MLISIHKCVSWMLLINDGLCVELQHTDVLTTVHLDLLSNGRSCSAAWLDLIGSDEDYLPFINCLIDSRVDTLLRCL